jgi:hypothetical protein
MEPDSNAEALAHADRESKDEADSVKPEQSKSRREIEVMESLTCQQFRRREQNPWQRATANYK